MATGASISRVFEAPIDKVYDIIIDYKSYPEFVAGTDGIEVLHQGQTEAKVRFSLNVVKEFSYILNLKQERPTMVSWTLDSGDLFKKNNGLWTLKDLGDGTTQADYSLDLSFKLMVPKMILNKLMGSNLPAMMDSFAKRMK